MRRLVLEQPASRAAIWAVRIALFACVVTAYGLIVVRGGQQGLPGFAAFGSGFALAALALVLALVAAAAIWSRGLTGARRVLMAAALAAGLLSVPAYVVLQVLTLPALTDISTDLDNPPPFSRSRAALAARDGHVPPEVTRATREPQRAAYSRLTPFISDLPPEETFALAIRAAQALGWRIIEQAPPGGRSGLGRIEAIATSRILKLENDITIRVRPRVDGARVDVRSASRLPWHDLGGNAARVAAFLDEMQALSAAR
jgi:hypothetical protein